MSGAQRYNAKAAALFEDCRQLERERRAQGLGPPHYGLLAPDDFTRAWEASHAVDADSDSHEVAHGGHGV